MMTVKLEGLDRLKRLLDPKKVERAATSAINRVANSTRSEASNVIRTEKGWRIKKADLDPRLSVKQARQGDLLAVLTPRTKKGKESIALPYFGARQVRRTKAGVTMRQRKKGVLVDKKQKRSRAPGGVTVQVLRGGKKAHYPEAFIAQMKSGHAGVFRRTTILNDDGREKIAEVRTISVLSMFSGIRRRLLEYARKRWRIEIKHQLKYQLGRKN